MTSSFFFLQAEKNHKNQKFLEKLEIRASERKEQAYVISKPLGDARYTYSNNGGIVVLSPKRKITFIDFSEDNISFDDFVEDFLEDLASISDKYRYKDAIGRPRSWREDLVAKFDGNEMDVFEKWEEESRVDNPAKQRIAELLVSLLTGSINDIEKVKADLPTSLLEKIKRKILLFDADQTRFIYEKREQPIVRIQGLSGTGKTELLMHKLRDLYVNFPKSKIVFTCHNRILADAMERRIPEFFNFMKVEEQIAWNERLWCFHAWGSANIPNSGTYRLICELYKLPFNRYSPSMTFDRVCSEAVAELKSRAEVIPQIDFILIDESQDFPNSFIELCKLVTNDTVYVAGDIFQSIFDATIAPSIEPDYLLSKCYRTDPRTLMFAHAIGMGLFESTKLRWLEDNEWRACGYIVDKAAGGSLYRLSREPLRRFEDIDNKLPSVIIETVQGRFYGSVADQIITAITQLAKEHTSLTPDDVGIIILDTGEAAYALADKLAVLIPRSLGWQANKAHESKRRIPGELFISNRNNVKGLEFPFVICVSKLITSNYRYRNALYMTLTRSFIQSRLIVSEDSNSETMNRILEGLVRINVEGKIEVSPPSEEEKIGIKTTFKMGTSSLSLFDMANQVFDELGVIPIMRPSLHSTLKSMGEHDPDLESLRETVTFLYSRMMLNRS